MDNYSGRMLGNLTEAAERDLWLLLDHLDAAVRAKYLPSLRRTTDMDDENYATLCNVDDARGWFDDLEARCDVDVQETREAYEEWLRDYFPVQS